jgi:hypothetical protein
VSRARERQTMKTFVEASVLPKSCKVEAIRMDVENKRLLTQGERSVFFQSHMRNAGSCMQPRHRTNDHLESSAEATGSCSFDGL